jgi:hypothetical protein
MGLEKLLTKINDIIVFFEKQNIPIEAIACQELNKIKRNIGLDLPLDFEQFYLKINGMGEFYPNYMDINGFLFYPIEAVVSLYSEYRYSILLDKEKIFIFANYMHRSWLYGFKFLNKNEYIIGGIPEENTFTPITNSLAEFIDLYINDSPLLYDI